MALDELRQEGQAAADKLSEREAASRERLKALQSALSAAQVLTSPSRVTAYAEHILCKALSLCMSSFT